MLHGVFPKISSRNILNQPTIFSNMAFQRIVLLGICNALWIQVLAASDAFLDDSVGPLDIGLHHEDLGDENTKIFASDFDDETDTLHSELLEFAASSFPRDFSNDVQTPVQADQPDTSIFSSLIFPSLEEEPDPGFSLTQDLGCSLDDDQSINKRETGKTCNSDSAVPDPPFERGSSTDPEFYGISILGYTLEQLGQDDETNRCRRDILDLPKYMVCDSGENKDRIIHYANNLVLATGITLVKCERGMHAFSLYVFNLVFLGQSTMVLRLISSRSVNPLPKSQD